MSIPDLRDRLFDAAERVLTEHGPAGLTGRAVTGEAGCATGVLYRHFDDFDQFVDEFHQDRVARLVEPLLDLPSQAGRLTVAANLQAAAEVMYGPRARVLAGLVSARPHLLDRSRDLPMAEARPTAPPSAASAHTVREALDNAIINYLRAEKDLCRLPDDADVEAITLTLVATIHDLLLHGRRPDMGDDSQTIARAIRALVGT